MSAEVLQDLLILPVVSALSSSAKHDPPLCSHLLSSYLGRQESWKGPSSPLGAVCFPTARL